MSMQTETAHFYVTGCVQGVGYRAWTVRTARQLNLTGWVRNRMNGSVEICATGTLETINLFRQMCLKGPLWSRVDRLEAITIPDAIQPVTDNTLFVQMPTV